MERYSNNVQDTLGNAVDGVTVTVRRSSDSVLATLYSDNGVTSKANPFTNDSDGEFFFYAANEEYDVILTGPVSETLPNVRLFDPLDTVLPRAVLSGSDAGPTAIALGDIILADTNSNTVTLTLPTDPGTGVFLPAIVVQDAGGNAATNNITVQRNGENINGAASDQVISTNYQRVEFRWAGSSLGWLATVS